MTTCAVGARLGCPACGAEFIVVKAPGDVPTPTCGGVSLVRSGESIDGVAHEDLDETRPGKRYGLDEAGLDLLCTKGGTGRIELHGVAIPVRDAKLLPSSD